MCVNDRNDVTLAVKLALNPNTTNQQRPNAVQNSHSQILVFNFCYLLVVRTINI